MAFLNAISGYDPRKPLSAGAAALRGTAKPSTGGMFKAMSTQTASPIGEMAGATAGLPSGSVPPQAGSQQSAQAWINNAASGQGGTDAYIAKQNAKLATATANHDTNMLNALSADSARTGLTYGAPKIATPIQTTAQPISTFTPPSASSTAQIQSYAPAVPVMDEAAIRKYAEDQVKRKLGDARLTADQSIANSQLTAQQQSDALKTNYDKMYTTINEDRNLENARNDRTLSPFSGQSGFLKGIVEQNRARTDRENQDTLQTNQGNIAAQSAQLKQQIDDKYAALANAAPDEREALFQSIKNDERNYDLAVHQQVSSDLLNNSQLQNTAFGQALQTFMTNYGVQQDQVKNDAEYGGTYKGGQTQAAQNQSFNQNLATNQYNQGVKNDTFNQNMQVNEQAYSHARDSLLDKRYQTEFDNNVKQQGFKNALEIALQKHQISNDNAQIAISQQNADTNATQTANSNINQLADNQLGQDKLAWDKNPLNPANITKKPTVSFKDDPDFQSDAANMVKNPLAARTELRDNSDAYIKKYGMDGYNALISVVNR